MSNEITCTCCGSRDDLSLQPLKVVDQPRDAYLGLLAGAFVSAMAGSAATFLSMPDYQTAFQIVGFAGLTLGMVYYSLRGTSAGFYLLFCDACWRKLSGRDFNRIAGKAGLVALAVGGAITISAVMKSDDYIYLPVVAAAILGIVAWYFRLFARPKFVSIGEKTTVIHIPDFGNVEVLNR
jgi:hypothetical protein